LAHFTNDGLILEEEEAFKPIIERRRKKKVYAEIGVVLKGVKEYWSHISIS
jgi:hypothetical protein